MEVICMNIRNDMMAKSFAPRSISSFPSSIFTSCTLLLRDLQYLLIACYQVEISIAVEKPRFNLGKMNGSHNLLVETRFKVDPLLHPLLPQQGTKLFNTYSYPDSKMK